VNISQIVKMRSEKFETTTTIIIIKKKYKKQPYWALHTYYGKC
jgi:hypothetical protein